MAGSETEGRATRRLYRRTGRYGASINVGMTPDMRAALEAEADAATLPVAEVTREAIAIVTAGGAGTVAAGAGRAASGPRAPMWQPPRIELRADVAELRREVRTDLNSARCGV